MAETVTRCRSCGARCFWAETVNGKPMLVDAEPVPDGNLEIQHHPPNVTPRAIVNPSHDGPRHKSHFASCAHAKQWRKPREGRQ